MTSTTHSCQLPSRPLFSRVVSSSHVTRLWSCLALSLALLLSAVAPAAAKKEKKAKAGVVAGVVKSPMGETLHDVVVTLHAADGAMVGEALSNRKGEFEIEVAPGNYTVKFAGDGYAPFEADVELGESSQQDLVVTLVDAVAHRRNQAIEAYNAGASAVRANDLDTALAKFQEAAEVDPELAPPHIALADVYLQNGDADAAVVAIEKFMAMKPDDEQGRKVAYEAYRRSGMQDKAKAIADTLESTDMTADLAIGIYNEGAMASQQGDYELALAKFKEAAEMDPTLAQAHAGAASIHYNKAELAPALVAAEQALAIEAENRQALRIRYLVFDAEGDLEKAKSSWDAYRALDENGAIDLLYKRAEMDFNDGNNERAREALGRVLELRPDLARAHYTLGLTYTGSDPAKAKEHLEKFIELAPDDPEVEAAREIISYFK